MKRAYSIIRTLLIEGSVFVHLCWDEDEYNATVTMPLQNDHEG